MKTYDAAIILYLNNKGVKQSNKGYSFLFEAIRIGAESPNAISKVTDVYSMIAKSYGTEAYNVERGIRYAISALCVTNKEFISRAVDVMKSGYAMKGTIRQASSNRLS